jgi:hypothetical protein
LLSIEEVVGEDVVSETEVLRQPDKDIAIIIAAVKDPHFLNRAMLKTAVNILFMLFSLIFLKSPFNYLYEKNPGTLHCF